MKPIVWVVLALALFGMALGACGRGGGTLPVENSVALSAPATEVLEGDTLVVSASTKASPLTWSSSDTRIACVNARGRVIGCRAGAVTIAATTGDGASGSLDLRVVADPRFNTDLPADPAQFRPVLSRETSVESCAVTLGLTGIAARIRREGCRPYHRLELPQAGLLGELGKPELPFYTLYFVIPMNPQTYAPATWTVEVERSEPLVYEGVRPWPHQPPRWISGDPKAPEETPPFDMDAGFYAETEAAWPQHTHQERAFQVGNLPVLAVSVVPADYVPAARRLRVFQTTRVRVRFEAEGALAMPRPLGDYKAMQERSADMHVAEFLQNGDLLVPIEAQDLAGTLPDIDDGSIQDLPFDMLILTRPSLEAPARRLARLRQDLGVRVWLAVCDEVKYPDAESLLALIHDLDDLNRVETVGGPRPFALRAICLFGDVEHIPTWDGVRVRDKPEPTEENPRPVSVTGTDLPYSTLHGTDWVSDVTIGRISVDDDGEGQDVVDKIRWYEDLPEGNVPHHMAVWGHFDDDPEQRTVHAGSVTFERDSDIVRVAWPGRLAGMVHVNDLVRPYDPDTSVKKGTWPGRVARFLSLSRIQLTAPWPHASVTGPMEIAFQDGQDDWEFLKSAERVRTWMEARGVEVTWGYTRNHTEPEPLPVPSYGFEGPLDDDLIGYGWDADKEDVGDAWHSGIEGIVLHSDHGHPERWWHPRFDADDIAEVRGRWHPILLSINCESGWFDSETDRIWVWESGAAHLVDNDATRGLWSQHGESFCETALRQADGGAIAVFGGSRGTDAGRNDKLIDGLFGAFYVDYEEGVAPAGPITRHAYRYLGDAIRAAKYTMRTWMMTPTDEGGGGFREGVALYGMQVWHLFGDPMLRLRMPQPLRED